MGSARNDLPEHRRPDQAPGAGRAAKPAATYGWRQDRAALHTTSLTYARGGDSYLIVASNAGADRYPGWYHNLREHPDCEINIGPKRFAMTARRIPPDDAAYQRLWQLVTKNVRTGTTATRERHHGPSRSRVDRELTSTVK
jgi:deazaflavin-dependent oxidoreductase (nitroreductase family)